MGWGSEGRRSSDEEGRQVKEKAELVILAMACEGTK